MPFASVSCSINRNKCDTTVMHFSVHQDQACFHSSSVLPQRTILRRGSNKENLKAIVMRATDNNKCAVYAQDECAAIH